MSDLPEHPLLHEIATAVGTPYDAIAGCMGSIQEVAPGLLAAIARAAETPVTSQSELNLVYYGVHILGAAREPRLQAPLLRLLRMSDEELEAVLGSDHVTTVPQIALGAFDGDAQALFDLLWDAEANEYARMTLFGTVAYLTWQGRIPAETTRAALYRFDAERPIPDGDLGWNGWETAIELLGWEELAPLVEAAYADGRLDTGVSDLQWFRNALAAAASAAPDDHRRFEDEGYGYIEDLLEAIAFPAPPLEGLVDVAADALDDELDDELDDAIEHEEPAKWMAGAQEPRRNPLRHVGRNDPCPCGSGKKYKKCCLVA